MTMHLLTQHCLKIKEILKGMHFVDTDDVRSNITGYLKAIPQNHFQNCF
jgi:hypothetical protein